MLLNITYNFGNHRTVTKRLNFAGHAKYILSLSAEELKTVDLLYYHEPNKDELFAIQNLRAYAEGCRVGNEMNRAEVNDEIFPPFFGKAADLKNENNSSRPVQILFLDEAQMNARYSQEDSGGGECMCDWDYRTRCTCGFEEKSNIDNSEVNCPDFVWCQGCGNEDSDCECPNLDDGHGDTPQNLLCYGDDCCICGNCTPYLYPAITPKPYEVNTNLLSNADYFRKRAREKTLAELNNLFADKIENGETAMLATFEPWLIEVLREKGYDIELVSIDQLEDKECENDVTVYGYVAATVFLAGRN